MVKKMILGLLLGVVVPVLFVNNAMAFVFSDGFEGSSFDPFWTVSDSSNLVNNNGIASLSTDIAHSGSQSFKGQSQSGSYYSTARIDHNFGQPMTGDVSVWLYDGYPGYTGSTYALLDVSVSGWSWGGKEGIFDNVGSRYMFLGSATGGGWIYSGIPRTLGWHKLDVSVDDTGSDYFIDNTLVYSDSAMKSFDTVGFGTWTLPYYNPKNYYFDDFNANVEPVNSAVPEPASMLLLGSGLIGLVGRRKFTKF